MSDYKNYLAASILTEQKIVTYRLLSRALKVHVNTAKEMLFDFHQKQNAKNPGTIHATYLIIGTRQDKDILENSDRADHGTFEDGFIQSSPYTCSPPSISDDSVNVQVKTITLVRETDLENIRSKYEHIDSIHIYSLGPYSVKDLQILSETTQRLNQLCSGEDPTEFHSLYGTIQNKNLKLRVERRPGITIQSSTTKKNSSTQKVSDDKKVSFIEKSIDSKSAQLHTEATPGAGKNKSIATVAVNPPENATVDDSTVKTSNNVKVQKRAKSSIFSAFAKTGSEQNNQNKNKNNEGRHPTTEKNVPKISEDHLMKDVFDDEEIHSLLPSSIKDSRNSQKSIKEREQELKKMMEDDDDECGDEEKKTIISSKSHEKDTTILKEVSHEKNDKSSMHNGNKRRCRRKVVKKSTFKDEEGYLVTKEETAWESFSEDEPVVLLPKPTVKDQSTVSSKLKKGTVGKSTQGNIMSFFGKKS
ncbi:hypothetical protein HI914_04111 [Erysiphe necator]|nr:hypothetical protein HI914_04111 [Erysiphe necator]